MSMSAGIAGSRRRWDKEVASGVNVDMASELSGAPTTRPIRLEILSGVTVGAISGDALAAGDLSSLSSVDCRIAGSAHGFGGAANGGAAGHAIDANNQSNLTINVETGGEVRGGGGGGGAGGLGGYGDNITGSWSAYRYKNTSPISLFALTNTLSCWWDDVELHTGHTDGRVYDLNIGGYVYQRGTFVVNATYYTRRASGLATGAKGAGGAGGAGQGYGQSAATGNAGAAGTYRAGDGGTGGTGGAWATAGSIGGTGGTGYKYTTSSSSVSGSGATGASGGAAGKAVYNVTGVTINNNGGTISGTIT